MAVFDNVFPPDYLERLDPAVRRKITMGVEAGAAAAAAIAAKQHFPAVTQKPLADNAKKLVTGFRETLEQR